MERQRRGFDSMEKPAGHSEGMDAPPGPQADGGLPRRRVRLKRPLCGPKPRRGGHFVPSVRCAHDPPTDSPRASPPRLGAQPQTFFYAIIFICTHECGIITR